MDLKTDIIIVGAGLTGLTIGYYLKKAGKKFIILEKDNKPGGVIQTSSEDGFIYEKGPNTGVLSTAEIAQLFEDLKEHCVLEVANPDSKKRLILKNGKFTPLPSGPCSAVSTPLFTLKDKFRILGEPFRKPGTNPDETVAELVRRRMGKSFLDYAVNPFISGVYAGDPEKLVTRYALPKLYALEQNYGSFIGGSIAKAKVKKTEAEKKATREVFSVKGGLENLISALSQGAGKENILTGSKHITVHPAAIGFTVTYEDNFGKIRQIDSKAVITTTGGYTLPDMLPFIPSETIQNVSGLNYGRVVQVSAGYKKWSGGGLKAFGGLVPAVERRDILGILFPSSIFEGRAPEGGALLSVFLGGVRNPGTIEKADNEIAGIVLKEISATLSNKADPDLLRINRYIHAIPQYEKSSGLRFEAIKNIQEKHPGLILAGNIRDGIGMADRVKQAKNIADTLIAVK